MYIAAAPSNSRDIKGFILKVSNLLVLPILATSSVAYARPPRLVDTAGKHEHDGFMLRLGLGFGYNNWELNDGDGTVFDVGGFGLASTIALGGVVAKNLAIHAEWFYDYVGNPNISRNGREPGEATGASQGLNGFGVGATYYFMPINIYASLTLGGAQTFLQTSETRAEPDFGFALNATVGKEFWVGDDWGIGVAAQFTYAHVPIPNVDSSSSYKTFNILFSAT